MIVVRANARWSISKDNAGKISARGFSQFETPEFHLI